MHYVRYLGRNADVLSVLRPISVHVCNRRERTGADMVALLLSCSFDQQHFVD